jgi:protein-tyrosine phosphatase
MIDVHCHVLPGVDDGPATMQEAIELVRGARADGIETIVATPHVDASHPEVRSALVRAAVPELRARLARAGVDVEIKTGAEVAFTRAVELDDDELQALTLGGAGWLLLECPLNRTSTPGFISAARMLARRGHRILLAHPERCPIFLRAPAELDELVADGMLAQVTARSLDGRFGRTVRDLSMHLVAHGCVHVVASDGHDENRPARIASHLSRTAVPPALAHWLTCEMPAALLAGGGLPRRPKVLTTRSPRGLARLVGRRPGERPVKYT